MDRINEIIAKSTKEIVEKTVSDKKIKKLNNTHTKKVHFIPKNYRIMGGLLQSMNIQFGDFIEKLFEEIVKSDDRYEIVEGISGTNSRDFFLSQENDTKIDNYISIRRLQEFSEEELKVEFQDLINDINDNCLKCSTGKEKFRHDIDLFFKEKDKENYYYAEIKYNDDHDSGKYIDINRKFLKTYAFLYSYLLEKNLSNNFKLKPCLFFFNNKKMKTNEYIPEDTNIYRGEEIFEEFFDIFEYDDIQKSLLDIGQNTEMIKVFDDLYKKVMEL